MIDARLSLLLRLLGQAFGQPSWHGPNLLGSLRGLSPDEAAWRPAPGRHNAWEIAVHAAYWKYRVYRRLTDEPPRAFGPRGSDWFERPGAAADWSADVALLRAWHERLTAAVTAFAADALDERPGRSPHTYLDLVLGAAAHDTYHAGQVRLLRRLAEG